MKEQFINRDENIGTFRDISRYEQLLLLPECLLQLRQKVSACGKRRVNPFPHSDTFFTPLQKMNFENSDKWKNCS